MRRGETVVFEGMSCSFLHSCWARLFVMQVRAKSIRPLHGLPILVKDAMGTNDQMETTGKCGLRNWDWKLLIYVQLDRMLLSVSRLRKMPLLSPNCEKTALLFWVRRVFRNGITFARQTRRKAGMLEVVSRTVPTIRSKTLAGALVVAL